MKTWNRVKRCLHRVLHPNAHIRAAIRLGRMLERKEASKPLPPIFGEKPVYIAIPQQIAPPVYELPERATDPEVYHRRLQARRAIAQHSTSMIRKTILLSAADLPPLDDGETVEIPAWLR